jgi:hypothetical protein
VSEWRQLAPCDAMNRAREKDGADWDAKMIHISGFVQYLDRAIQDLVMPRDIIIVQRNIITPEIVDIMRYWQGLGKSLCVDLDDMYQSLMWSNPAHAFWIENSAKLDPPPLVALERGLKQSNGLISPNRNLLSDWSYVTKGFYLPNYARSEWWTDLPTRVEMKERLGVKDRIVIGWGGSVSHYDGWWGSGLREAAALIARKYPQVTFMICGNDPRIYEQLPVPFDQRKQQPGVEPSAWPKIVKSFDIGLAPLHGYYDQRRSWLKGLEYGLAGVPWVGTTGEPYSDLRGLGYLIDNGVDSWYEHLCYIIDHLEKEQTVAEQRIPTFQQWFIGNQLETCRKVYQGVIDNFRMEHGRLPNVYYVNWEGRKPPTAQKGTVLSL